jgi:transcriptional regulator with XRE-family HTH domain
MSKKTDTLGEQIRRARVAESLGLRELARRVDKSPSYVSDIEYDRRVPSEETLVALCEVLHLDFDALLSVAGRLGDDADRYLREEPAAGMLLRRAQESKLTNDELRQLIDRVEEIRAERDSE